MNKDALKLYAITDRSWLNGETLADEVEKALRGGATIVQLREKDLDHDALLKEAVEIGALCRRYAVPFIINDDVQIALQCGADGVHVGQEDMAAAEARRLLGPDKIVGVTCKTVEQAIEAARQGADYLGSGAMFPSLAKPGATGISFDTLRAICAAVETPVVAIGGITHDNMDKLQGTGIAGVCVVGAIFAQPDPEQAARALKEKVTQIL